MGAYDVYFEGLGAGAVVVAVIADRRERLLVDAIQDRSNQIVASEIRNRPFDKRVRRRPGRNDEQDGVRQSRQQIGVGNQTHWRRVEEDPIKGGGSLIQQGLHPRRGQLGHRVRIRMAGRHDAQLGRHLEDRELAPLGP